MKTAKQILIDARQRITDRANWTQGATQRDARNKPVGNHGAPVCWCAMGALYAEAKDQASTDRGQFRAADDLLYHTAQDLGFTTMIALNDSYKYGPEPLKQQVHAAVLMAFDLAIERSK